MNGISGEKKDTATPLVIRNATIIDTFSCSKREGADILIEDGRIKKIGSLQSRGELAEIDGRGLFCLPGCVNTHSHTAMTLLRGCAEDASIADWFNKYVWRYEKNLRPRDVYIGTLLGSAEMLLAGVTTVADHYFFMDQAYKAYEEVGIRADLAWAVFGTGAGWEESYQASLSFIESHRGRNPRLTLSLGPHSLYICPRDFIQKIVRLSHDLGLKMHIHASEEKNQLERSLAEFGRTPVSILHELGVIREGTILAHAYWTTDEDLELISKSGAGVAHCAKTYLKIGDVNDLLPRARAAGVKLGLGTDGPCSNNTLNIFEAARDAAFIAKASTGDPEQGRIEEILPLLSSGAGVLSLDDGNSQAGRIAEGAPADLLLIDPSTPNMTPEYNIFANILYSLGERNIHTVVVDGEVLVSRGEFTKVDLGALYGEAGEIVERLIRDAGDDPMQTYNPGTGQN